MKQKIIALIPLALIWAGLHFFHPALGPVVVGALIWYDIYIKKDDKRERNP